MDGLLLYHPRIGTSATHLFWNRSVSVCLCWTKTRDYRQSWASACSVGVYIGVRGVQLPAFCLFHCSSPACTPFRILSSTHLRISDLQGQGVWNVSSSFSSASRVPAWEPEARCGFTTGWNASESGLKTFALNMNCHNSVWGWDNYVQGQLRMFINLQKRLEYVSFQLTTRTIFGVHLG